MRQLQSFGIFCIASISVFAGAAAADTLTLRDGSRLTGTFLGGSAREIRMDLGDRVQSFDVDRVSALRFDSNGPVSSAPPPPPPPAPGDNSQQPPPDNNSGYNNNPAPPTYASNVPPPQQPQQGPLGVTIPAGTEIVVRMIDSVDSDSSRLGSVYRASVDEPVIVNGQTVIPRGAAVTTKVVEDRQANKIAGRTVIGLVAQTVNVNGQDIPLTTSDVTQQSGSRGKRSAGVIGGGTALGAILGGIVGGGKGAAIGAVSGAAVGTGAQVLTKGEKVHIPSESRLTFTLSNPINL